MFGLGFGLLLLAASIALMILADSGDCVCVAHRSFGLQLHHSVSLCFGVAVEKFFSRACWQARAFWGPNPAIDVATSEVLEFCSNR